jgi:hypothetical protein
MRPRQGIKRNASSEIQLDANDRKKKEEDKQHLPLDPNAFPDTEAASLERALRVPFLWRVDPWQPLLQLNVCQA